MKIRFKTLIALWCALPLLAACTTLPGPHQGTRDTQGLPALSRSAVLQDKLPITERVANLVDVVRMAKDELLKECQVLKGVLGEHALLLDSLQELHKDFKVLAANHVAVVKELNVLKDKHDFVVNDHEEDLRKTLHTREEL